jgi:16S rRNA (guanine527-N7)-methyltransferase
MARVKQSPTVDDVPPDAPPALARFVELLARWNVSINLVSARDMSHLWQRHVADSLQLAPLWPAPPVRAIDLGSGAGFPGLILSLAFSIPFDLIEQDRAKASFLREAARVTGAPATVCGKKIEAVHLAPAPLVTARALAPLSRLLEFAQPLLAPDGVCLFLKGQGVEAEIAEARRHWRATIETFPSRTDQGGAILRVSRLARA